MLVLFLPSSSLARALCFLFPSSIRQLILFHRHCRSPPPARRPRQPSLGAKTTSFSLAPFLCTFRPLFSRRRLPLSVSHISRGGPGTDWGPLAKLGPPLTVPRFDLSFCENRLRCPRLPRLDWCRLSLPAALEAAAEESSSSCASSLPDGRTDGPLPFLCRAVAAAAVLGGRRPFARARARASTRRRS